MPESTKELENIINTDPDEVEQELIQSQDSNDPEDVAPIVVEGDSDVIS